MAPAGSFGSLSFVFCLFSTHRSSLFKQQFNTSVNQHDMRFCSDKTCMPDHADVVRRHIHSAKLNGNLNQVTTEKLVMVKSNN